MKKRFNTLKMKKQLLTLVFFLTLATMAMAQKKIKTSPSRNIDPATLPALHLKQSADVPAAPRNLFAVPTTMQNTPVTLQTVLGLPQGMRVTSFANNVPNFIAGTLPNAKATDADARRVEYLTALAIAMQQTADASDFRPFDTQTDALGQTHTRCQQFHKGIKVWGGQIILHEQAEKIILMNGRYFPSPSVTNLTPSITETQAIETVKAEVSKTTPWRTLDAQQLEMLGGNQAVTELVIFHQDEQVNAPYLAYHITARPHLMSKFEYFVDAQTGVVLSQYSSLCDIAGGSVICNHPNHHHDATVSTSETTTQHAEEIFDGPFTANATNLAGTTSTINTYLSVGRYYLIDGSRPMFNPATASQLTTAIQDGALYTLDAANRSPENSNFNVDLISSTNNTWSNPTAVSAHFNGGEAYRYYKEKFNRNSINGRGGYVTSIINVAESNGSGMDNAFWDGQYMYYGNGSQFFTPLAKSLDVAGHEISHGVVQNTANLTYQGESGALNESFADVFGAMIDRANWTIGEGIIRNGSFPTGALRDLSNPNNGGTRLGDPGYQPANVSQKYTGTQDNGGVHINSGITNYAFYLFANNASVGKNIAEQVYYRALTTYLVASSKFIDCRSAVERACTDLYAAQPAVLAAAQSAFTSVGIGSGGSAGGAVYQQDLPVNPGNDWLLYSTPDSASLYVYSLFNNGTTNLRISTTKHRSRPSISDDGSEIVFIGANDRTIHYIRIDWAAGSVGAEQTFPALGTNWDNVVISKDGNRLAATTPDIDTAIYIYNDPTGVWRKMRLYNPTTSTNGNTTGAVLFPDALDWNHTGDIVLYDAYNVLNSRAGNNSDYWDVGFLKAWDNASNNFGSGQINKLFTLLPEGTNAENATYARNSPYIVTYDFVDDRRTTRQFNIWASNTQTGVYDTIFSNNTLGYPQYSRLDDKVTFNVLNSGAPVVGQRTVTSNKLKGTGNTTVLRSNARWGTWFANGTRRLTQTRELDENTQVSIFPNPVGDVLTLSVELKNGASEGSIALFDLTGRQVFTQALGNLTAGAQVFAIPMKDLAAGIYLARCTVGTQSTTMKVVKQ